MFIILKMDDWEQYNVVKNRFDKPMIFQAESEAFDYCDEMEIYPFQLVEVTI
jgi:hypothetical protein